MTEAEQKALTPRQIITAMSGLIVAMLLAQLDNMIVAPALPTIVGDLGGLSHLSWVVTGYILASTVSTPIWGKLGDLFGHKQVFMTSIVMFLAGSALCGAAQDMTQLVLFRAFQGLGAGGLMVGIMSVIGMLVSPRERGKYIGVMMAVMPAAMIGGPLIGGWITDNASWRWAFYVNLPLGAIALAVIWATLHLTHEDKSEKKVVIDWTGSALLVTWLTSLVLMITWGGTTYPWNSWQIYLLGAVAAVGFAIFIWFERRTPEPVMPLDLFKIPNFSLANTLGFVAGFAMFGSLTFLPQYQQFVQGSSATNSGLLLMPMMVAAMVFSMGGGQIISRTGKYKAFPIIGTIALCAGMFLFATMGLGTTKLTTAIFMIVLGAGMGCLMQTTNLIAQNSVELKDIGAATGAATFTRTLGGSLGVSILGALYTHQLTSHMAAVGLHAASGSTSTMTPKALDALKQSHPSIAHMFQQAVVAGSQHIYVVAGVVAVVAVVLAWFVREVPLRGGAPAPSEQVGERVDALEDQMGVMLPGDRDAAVQLDHL